MKIFCLTVLFALVFGNSPAQTWTNLGPENSIPGSVSVIFVNDSGKIFAPSSNLKIYTWSGTQWEIFAENYLPDTGINQYSLDFVPDGPNRIWISYERNGQFPYRKFALGKLENGVFSKVLDGPNYPFKPIEIEMDKNGKLYLAKEDKIYTYQNGNLDSIPCPQGFLAFARNRSLDFTEAGELLICHKDYDTGPIYVKKWTGNSWFDFTTTTSFPGGTLTQLKAGPQNSFFLFINKLLPNDTYSTFLKIWNGSTWLASPDSLPVPNSGFPPPTFELDGQGNPIIDGYVFGMKIWKNNSLQDFPRPFIPTPGAFLIPGLLYYHKASQTFYQSRSPFPSGLTSTVSKLEWITPVDASLNSTKGFQIGPNPCDDFLGIFPKIKLAHFDYQVYDGPGKLINRQENCFGDVRIRLTGFKNGIYQIQIRQGSSLENFRILKSY